MDYTDKNPDKFSIVIGDIFDYEKEIYYNSKDKNDTTSFLHKLYIEMESHLRGYGTKFTRKSNDELINIREDFSCDYFYSQNDIYYYTERCVVNKHGYPKQPFNFFFALTLRQYERKLSEIYGFLDYQLSKNFKKNLKEFLDFMKFVIRQHGYLLSKEVILTTEEWLGKKRNPTDSAQKKTPQFLQTRTKNNQPANDIKSNVIEQSKTVNVSKEINSFEDFFYNKKNIKKIFSILRDNEVINIKNEWVGNFKYKAEIMILIEELELKSYIKKIQSKSKVGRLFAGKFKLIVDERTLRKGFSEIDEKERKEVAVYYAEIIPELHK